MLGGRFHNGPETKKSPWCLQVSSGSGNLASALLYGGLAPVLTELSLGQRLFRRRPLEICLG